MPDASKKPLLIVITGPTASGKTSLAVRLAKHFGCSVISADSRQVFRELSIGSAAPSEEEMQGVRHYFVGSHSITEPFNAGIFANDCMGLLEQLFRENPIQILCGGTGLYIDALLNGLNDLPEANEELRDQLRLEWEENPNLLIEELQQKDPEFASKVDLNNPRRIMRALEVIRLTSKAYSGLRTGAKQVLFFDYKCFALMPEREELYARINERTPAMMEQGWLSEVKHLVEFRNLNALQTVGYRELFEYLDGKTGLEETIDRIRMNTRRYAKRQVTWIRNQLKCEWIKPENGFETILNEIKNY